jgi:hypothetical protein
MLPRHVAAGALQSLACGGAPVAAEDRSIKGIDYVLFPANSGTCEAHYSP